MASLRDGSIDSEETVTVPSPPTLLPDVIVDELRTVVESPHVTPEDRSTARAMLNEHEEAKALEQQNSDVVTPALRARMQNFQQTQDTQRSKGKHRVQFSANDSDPVAPTTRDCKAQVVNAYDNKDGACIPAKYLVSLLMGVVTSSQRMRRS
ncbi:hypothetical protein NFJ02_41g106800 [Pycnococcus provasolii]